MDHYDGWRDYVPPSKLHTAPTVSRHSVKRSKVVPPGVLFMASCMAAHIDVPTPEFRFHPKRRWRFDFAWPDHKVALEVQGGIFTQGRHTRGAALEKEHEKLNSAAILGWRVLYVTPKQVANGEALAYVTDALNRSQAPVRGAGGAGG